ncbi:MAG: hypothetical protein R3D68_01555 [Hyphomicrobiaceae bacterium]
MARKDIVITGGDSRYFGLMQGCLRSLRNAPETLACALGVLDCGLTADEAAWCRSIGATIVEPGWDVAFAGSLTVHPAMRAMTARPHLRRYFPGFDTYLWIDADAWVQEGAAARLFLDAAHMGDIAIVPEVHRSYSNLRHTREDFETANAKAYADAFGPAAAQRLIRMPLVNAGVFAIAHTSPAWGLWADVLADAATRSTNLVDQIALNVAIYDHGLGDIRLPASCNWIAHLCPPAWDGDRGAFVEPDPPFTPIGILHMTLDTKWKGTLPLPALRDGRIGGTAPRSLQYAGT